ncbi:MAG: GNAT family N-acetyltransferase [Clostridia bacterium]|nr:GNAT family N-acetyltransferase [Clostridia bacterium]
MDKIIIREATAEDAKALIEYTKIIGGESDNLTYGSEGMLITLEQEKAFLDSVKEKEHSVFYCAWQGSVLVGTANLSGMPRRMSHRAELGISVLKSYWNNGIGSMLMQKIIDYAKQHDIEIINLEVRSDNMSAIHLYEKYGYKKTGTIPAFFKINKEYVDFDIMSLDLR